MVHPELPKLCGEHQVGLKSTPNVSGGPARRNGGARLSKPVFESFLFRYLGNRHVGTHGGQRIMHHGELFQIGVKVEYLSSTNLLTEWELLKNRQSTVLSKIICRPEELT